MGGSAFAEYLCRRGFEYVTTEVLQHNTTNAAIHSMHWQMLLSDYDPQNTPGFVWNPENEDGLVQGDGEQQFDNRSVLDR
jgi:hypothetical protein